MGMNFVKELSKVSSKELCKDFLQGLSQEMSQRFSKELSYESTTGFLSLRDSLNN